MLIHLVTFFEMIENYLIETKTQLLVKRVIKRYLLHHRIVDVRKGRVSEILIANTRYEMAVMELRQSSANQGDNFFLFPFTFFFFLRLLYVQYRSPAARWGRVCFDEEICKKK